MSTHLIGRRTNKKMTRAIRTPVEHRTKEDWILAFTWEINENKRQLRFAKRQVEFYENYIKEGGLEGKGILPFIESTEEERLKVAKEGLEKQRMYCEAFNRNIKEKKKLIEDIKDGTAKVY